MSQTVPVLLLDDGELDDVQECLEEMNVVFGRVRGGAIVRNTPPPSRLLVSTPRRIDAVSLPAAGTDEAKRLVRIVVVNEDSTTLREQMRRIGFDYLVRRPVHPEALRLLLMRSLYAGEERRGEERVPMGIEVSFRTGLLPRRATMVDLSSRGCRLLSSYALEPGRRVCVQVPDGEREALLVRGQVIRISLDEHLGPGGPYSAAVAFEALLEADQKRLTNMLTRRAIGSARLVGTAGDEVLLPPEARAGDLRRVELAVDVRVAPTPEAVRAVDVVDESDPADEDPSGAERRRSPRGAFARRVPAFGDRAMRVLVARDLSVGGMRVEQLSGLGVGDRLHLAIYGSAADEPTLVWATVARDDGHEGIGLVFDDVTAAAAERIEKLLVDLPAIESLHDDEARAMGTVMTEILEA
jgi:PilZ domain-containing protein